MHMRKILLKILDSIIVFFLLIGYCLIISSIPIGLICILIGIQIIDKNLSIVFISIGTLIIISMILYIIFTIYNTSNIINRNSTTIIIDNESDNEYV